MIVDSSALIAVLRAEPEADEFAELIVSGPTRISAANWLEASMVAHGERGSAGVALLDRLVAAANAGRKFTRGEMNERKAVS